MSDSDLSSDFRADVPESDPGDAGDEPNPGEAPPEPETDTPSGTNLPYDPEEPIRVLFRGHAESYDQSFLVVVDVRRDDSAVVFDELHVLSTRERERLRNVALDLREGEFAEQFSDLINELDETDTKDSANLRNKLERVLRQSGTMESLTEPLFEGDPEEFESTLREFLLNEIFPGSQLELTVRLAPAEDGSEPEAESVESDSTEEDDDEEEEDDQESEKLLPVSPEVDPIDGVRLRDLRIGDSFDVRVVGHSVRDLRPEYVEGQESAADDQSKLFNAKLVGTEDVPVEGTRKYIVRMTEDIYGRCTLDPTTKVKIRNIEDLSFLLRTRRQIFYVLVVLLIFLFSASLVFFLFPEPLLNLLRAVDTSP